MSEPDVLARANLERIVKLFGARLIGEVYVELAIGNYLYRIYGSHIYRLRKISGEYVPYGDTCYGPACHMPVAEVMATAILLLHHDPSIFDRWNNNRGTWYV